MKVCIDKCVKLVGSYLDPRTELTLQNNRDMELRVCATAACIADPHENDVRITGSIRGGNHWRAWNVKLLPSVRHCHKA
eukprot:6462957-Amphidinium_carterae.2